MTSLAIAGTTLFVDERGPADGPAVLFSHGGPGGSCWDFMAVAGDRLAAEGIRIIGVDQRGVLRSDPLPDAPPLTVDLLVSDFEEIRRALGVVSWTVIGHSSGGGYAFDYALAHPDAIDGVVFDCPSLDNDATDRNRLPVVAAQAEALGRAAEAQECRDLAVLERRLGFDDRTWEVMGRALQDHYLDSFFFDETNLADYERLVAQRPDDLDWGRGISHLSLVADAYRDRTARFDDLRVPSMLVRGETDLVAAPSVIEAYRNVVGGPVHTVAGAAHFPHLERPDEYVRLVTEFVRR